MNNWKAFTLLFTISIIYACSVAKDPTPDAHPDAKVYTAVINTTNMGNSAEANIVD
ncbi:MAG: hypothetical protein K0R51_1805, partial [Cytophagaceae bacterium]|nr:hypothetical protein [Cytophagaceae bacterium]